MEESKDESYSLIYALFDRLLEDISKKEAGASRTPLSNLEIFTLCQVIEYECREDIWEEALKMGEDIEHLQLLPQLFENYFEQYPDIFPKELKLWTIAKFLALFSNPLANGKLGGFYKQHVILLTKFVPVDGRKFLLRQIVEALFALLTGKTDVSIRVCEGSEEAAYEVKCEEGCIKLLPVRIISNKPSKERVSLQLLTLLELMQNGFFDLNSLNEDKLLHKTWCAMTRACLIGNCQLKNKAILVIQRLLSLDLCNSPFAGTLLEVVIAVERVLMVYGGGEDAKLLEESLASCYRTFGNNLKRFRMFRTFGEVNFEEVLKWMVMLTLLCKEYFQCQLKGRLISLLSDFCSLLSQATEIDIDLLQTASAIAGDVAIIIQTIVAREYQISVSELGDLLSFILNLDNQQSSNALALQIVKIVADAKERFRDLEVAKAIRIQQLVISALKKAESASSVLSLVIPQSSELLEILQTVSTMTTGAEDIVLPLVLLISTLIDSTKDEQVDWVAFLSLPWLTEPVDSSRFKNSIPLLADVKKLAKTEGCISACSLNVKVSTLSALARMHCASEWRRIIFTRALESPVLELQRVALDHLQHFVQSIDVYAFKNLLDRVLLTAKACLEKDGGLEICSAAFKAIAHSFCVLDTKKVVADGEICAVCLQKETSTQKLDVDLINLFALFESLVVLKDKSVKLACCALLRSALNHVNFAVSDLIEEAVIHSLILMNDSDEEVLMEYNWCLIRIVQIRWKRLLNNIGELLTEMEQHGRRDAQLQYTLSCAQYATDEYLESVCFVKIVLLAVSNDCEEAVHTCAKLIENKTAASDPPITKKQLFLRRSQQICKYLAKLLVVVPFASGTAEDDDGRVDEKFLRKRGEDALQMFEKISELFAYVSSDGRPNAKSWLRDACVELIPSLIISAEASTEAAEVVMKKILEIRNLRVDALITESFPLLLSSLLEYKDIAVTKNAFRFIDKFSGGICDWKDLMWKNVIDCTVCLLQHISVSEDRCWHMMKRLYKVLKGDHAHFSLTAFVQERYLGILLRLRPAFHDDRFYAKRRILALSLSCMMRRIKAEGTDFLDATAGKMLALLRFVSVLGELSIAPFTAFVETLSDETLLSLLPQILVSIAPLLKYEGSRSILRFIFETKGLHLSSSVDFERISLMLWNNPKVPVNEFLPREHQYASPSKVLGACALLLRESSEEVSELVLHKILQVLETSDVNNPDDCSIDNLAAQLIPALLHTIRKSPSSECRRLASLAFGRMGAVDPGRIGLSSSSGLRHIDRRSKEIIFVDAGDVFFTELLERLSTSFSGILDAATQEECAYSIQMTLRELLHRNSENSCDLWNTLSEQCKKELSVFRATNYTHVGQIQGIPAKGPIIGSNEADGYAKWMSIWYIFGAKKTRDVRLKKLFEALHGMVKADAVFARFILPQILIEALIEDNVDFIQECENEMKSVLSIALTDEGWPRLAAHIVFAIVDCLERFSNLRRAKKIPSDMVLSRTTGLLLRLLKERVEDGCLLAVAVAAKCQCVTRALRWCEEYGINRDEQGQYIFDKAQYYALQQIYSHLDDLDGVLGAFETIKQNSVPSTSEQILAFEANGDYSEALPLYQLSSDQKLPLIKCLLKLNQPYLALTTAEAMLQTSDVPALAEGFRACQVEATWRLQKWTEVDKLVEGSPQMTTWGARNASILCSLKHRDLQSMKSRIKVARDRLVDALTAMTIEDSDTYSQAYKYIIQLHILSEIEDGKDSLGLLSGEVLTPEQLASVIDGWQKRSALLMQCTWVLEPIFTVRRGLLRLTNSSLAQGPICDLLLQSCRMSRLAGQLQVAWTFLVEAKALNVNHFEVAMEEARFLFEKGKQTQAINLLSKLLKERFPSKVQQLHSIIQGPRRDGLSSAQLKEALKNESKEEKANFVKVELLLADYALKAGACNVADLYSKYNALPAIADPSEDLFYRVAIFLDNYLYSRNENLLADKVVSILEAYTRVLVQGTTHLFHVMPRMLTIWLDNTQKKTAEGSGTPAKRPRSAIPAFEHRSARDVQADEKDITEMNNKMREAFNRLGHYVFYTAFAQLISRISHPNEEVFLTLKNILAELIVEYPHQCLWQSIAVYRSDLSKQQQRYDRCRMVFELAKRKDKIGQLKTLITQYEYIAAAFIRVAEDNSPPGIYTAFSHRYGFISKYLSNGIVDPSVKVTGPIEENVRPRLMVPLREMIEHAIPMAVPNSLSQFPVGESPTRGVSDSVPSFSDIFIESIDEEYLVMRSMVRPKRITLLASDGNRYALMCKAKDELRKDGRLMDINRMVNALLHQNADARRRQLSVRTYNVVPLQDAGGLIEWVPNLMTYRSVLEPLMAEKCKNVMNDKEWFTKWIPNGSDQQKLQKLRDEYFPRNPIVMADWFMRNFPDPCRWYAARLAFTHTSAVMSMVGFIIGLGDRHGENLLIDVTSGDAFHVDFNLLFNKGENLAVPEVVPFRLTRNIVNGFGATGVEGSFRRSCETCMRVLRENDEVLLTVLQTFVHDPLLEWMNTENRAQQFKQKQGIAARPSTSNAAQQQAHEAIEMIRSRLKGNIVSPKIYRSTLDSLPMSVEGQVGKLIELASDERNLAKMYIGWCPFL